MCMRIFARIWAFLHAVNQTSPEAHSICPQKQNQIRWSGRVVRSILRFCRFCLTQNRWSSAPMDLLPEQIRRSGQNRSWYLICYQTWWLRSSKARLSSSSFALPRNLLPFWFGAISSISLELWSFRRRRGKQRQCADLSSAVATWSSSPNLIIVQSFVNRTATSSCLLARVVVCFHFGLAHLFNFSQALFVATKRKAARRKCVDYGRAQSPLGMST